MKAFGFLAVTLTLALCAIPLGSAGEEGTGLERIILSPDGERFVRAASGEPFVPWGVNYDHDAEGRLLEDYWETEWNTVVGDFREIRNLGANVVRVHLQLGRFMDGPERPNAAALTRLARLVELAEKERLYLNLTGLGCYHREDVPAWYDALDEAARWRTQARFWEAVAKTCADSPAVFCYDLMNEPVLPGPGVTETDWLAGEFGGKHFVQRITLDLKGRTRAEVASAWVDQLTAAIHRHDNDGLITLGIIPWALAFHPGATKPLFYSEEIGDDLDFVSVHFYPKAGEIDQALEALAVYDLGKPLVIEEMFPLSCSIEELGEFVKRSGAIADGWISFYWGKTIEEYDALDQPDLGQAITRDWLKAFRELAADMKRSAEEPGRGRPAGGQ